MGIRNAAQKMLVIGDRNGRFPGIRTNRTFYIVCVSPNLDVGIGPTKEPDLVVKYTGQTVKVPAK